MKILRSLALAALLLPIAACDDPDEPGPGPIDPDPVGIVRGSVTVEGESLQGITVTLAGPATQTTTTDANGAYVFNQVIAGTYSVSLSNLPTDATFTNPTQQVTITTDGQTVSADFIGNFIRTAAITGVVTIDEEPVEGVDVALAGLETATMATDNLGTFAFTGLRAGDYEVTITSPAEDVNFGQTTQQVTISVGETAALAFSGFVPDEPTVTIRSITAGGINFPINPDAVAGVIEYTLLFDAGDETASRVAIWLQPKNADGTDNGDPVEIAAQDFTSSGSGAASDEAVFVQNTAKVMADGVTPYWLNGLYQPIARLTTVEGSTIDAMWTGNLTFANIDVLSVVRTSPNSDGVVSGSRRWFGGSAGVSYEARAVIYSTAVNIASIGVTGVNTVSTANATGSGDVDFGSGSGVSHVSTGNPASFSATFANNEGVVEDAPPAVGNTDPETFGQQISITQLIDDDGVDVLPDIVANGTIAGVLLPGQLMDFVAPVVDDGAPSEITYTTDDVAAGTDFDRSDAAPGRFFSAGTTFGLNNVSELGVGFVGGGAAPVAGVDMRFDVNDLIAGGGTADVFTDVVGVGMGANEISAERRSDGYELELEELMDALGNTTDLTAVGVTDDDVADDNVTDEFGVDFGAAAFSGIVPTPNGDANDGDPLDIANWFILNNDNPGTATDHTIEFTANDPALANGDTESGISDPGVDINFDLQPPGGTSGTITNVTCPAAGIEIAGCPGALPGVTTDVDIVLDMSAAATAGNLPDGAYILTADIGDNSTDENVGNLTWSIVLASTPPLSQLINPPPAQVNSSQTQLTFTIQGSVTATTADLNGDGTPDDLPLSEILLQLTDRGADLACGTGDETLIALVGGSGNAQQNEFDVPVTEATSFSRDFTLENPGAGSQFVCFTVSASDAALDHDGDDNPLTSTESTETEIIWN